MTRPRILLVGPLPPPYSGWAHVLASWLKPPFADRFELTAFDTKLREDHSRGSVDAEVLRRAAESLIGFPAAARSARPDMVVLFTGPYGALWRDLALLQTARAMGIPVVIRAFGGKLGERIRSLPAPARRMVCGCFGGARALLAEPSEMVQEFRELIPGVPTYQVPNFIHLDEMPSAEALPASDAPVRIVYLGNMTPMKGVEVILDSVDAVCARREAEFHFIGAQHMQAGYLDSFRARAARLRHGARVHVHGQLPRAEALRLAAGCHLFAFPSQWPGEGLPAALVETMAMGLVPVASRWRAIPELVSHRENGLLLERPDSRCLSAAILELAADRALHAELSTRARATVRERYGADAALEQWCRIFDEIARASRAISDPTAALRRRPRPKREGREPARPGRAAAQTFDIIPETEVPS
jgi:glycosyltransferase involved in cell wall biosynthesis